MRYRHIALFTDTSLREAERYYATLFDLEVVVREAPLTASGPNAEAWGQLRPDRTWDDAEAAGIEIGFVALQRDEVVLALFAAETTGDRLYAIGLVMAADDIDAVAGRLGDELIENRDDGWLAFVDQHGVRWQLSATTPFLGAGTARGMWLDA